MKDMRILQVKDHILKQLNLESAPDVSGIVENSNPDLKKFIDGVLEINNRMPHEPTYIQDDMPPDLNKRVFIPVETSEYKQKSFSVCNI